MLSYPIQIAVMICCAAALDWLLGDPRWVPHPVNGIGALARKTESLARGRISNQVWAGAYTSLIVYSVSFVLAYLLTMLVGRIHNGLGFVVAVLSVAATVAARDLVSHSKRVVRALEADDLQLARKQVSWMVGRDTEVLGQAGVVRATVESVAESITDGIISPLFYATLGGLLGGPPVAAALAMLYRAANTLDSLFGYRNQQYIAFGRVPARVDDVLNYLPARISAFCIVIAALLSRQNPRGAVDCWRRDALKHKSPNAGHAEAAMAGALGIKLGGPARYRGLWKEHPHLGDSVSTPGVKHIKRANRLVIVSEFIFVCVGTCLVAICISWI